MSDLSSRELLSRFRASEHGAADAIFDRYVRRLLKLAQRRISPQLARRIDPDDIVQSAYRSFFVHAMEGDYALRRAGDLWRLLAAITLHKLYGQVELHTAQRRDINKEDDCNSIAGGAVEDFAAEAVQPSPAEAAEMMEQLHVFMQRLTPLERSILELRLSGQTIQQIAGEVSRSQRTVRRLLQDLQQRLSTKLLE